MALLRGGMASLVLTLALVNLGGGGEPGTRPTQPKRPSGILLPPAVEAELMLDEGQRAKLRKLEIEFKQRRQGSLLMTGMKMKRLFDRLDEGADAREVMPVMSVVSEVTGTLQKMRQTRLDYEKKLLGILSEGQKAKYLAWRERSPREKRFERKGKLFDRIEPRGPLPDLDRELQLTPEQLKRLSEMEREWEGRFRALLTEEQRKRYDELNGRAPPRKAPQP
jgi:hypothetical protein